MGMVFLTTAATCPHQCQRIQDLCVGAATKRGFADFHASGPSRGTPDDLVSSRLRRPWQFANIAMITVLHGRCRLFRISFRRTYFSSTENRSPADSLDFVASRFRTVKQLSGQDRFVCVVGLLILLPQPVQLVIRNVAWKRKVRIRSRLCGKFLPLLLSGFLVPFDEEPFVIELPSHSDLRPEFEELG